MKKMLSVLMFAVPFVFPEVSQSAWRAELDLSSPAPAYVMRDALNGQFRAGFDKPLAHLERSGNDLLDLGLTHTWNAEHGNAATGLSLGKKVRFSDIGSLVGLSDLGLPPFLNYIDHITAISLTGAVMPFHTADVRTVNLFGSRRLDVPLIWGVGVDVDLSDVFAVLAKGL